MDSRIRGNDESKHSLPMSAKRSCVSSVGKESESSAFMTLLFAVLVATATLETHAASAPAIEWNAKPTLPIATVPFRFDVKYRTFGGPIISQLSATLNGTTIELAFCITQNSSSTAPAVLSFAIPVDGLAARSYDVRLTLLSEAEDGTECARPGLLGTSQVRVVPASMVGTIVEYYNVPRDHYFQTADANEIALLDAGAFVGWQRTGETYRVYAPEVVTADTPVRPVCRYYGKPELGLDTHFFSAFETECAAIPVAFPNRWTPETDNAYAIAIPSATTGTCAPGTLPVYRLFNGKPEVNHRYTISPAIRQQMIDAGWTPEGFGSLGVAMCAEALP